MLAAGTGTNPPHSTPLFISENRKDHLAHLELPSDLDNLIALFIKIDNRLFDRQQAQVKTVQANVHLRGHPQEISTLPRLPSPPLLSPVSSLLSGTLEQPMQLGCSHLSPARQKLILGAQIELKNNYFPIRARIDSGAEQSLLDLDVAKQILYLSRYKIEPLIKPVNVTAINGKYIC